MPSSPVQRIAAHLLEDWADGGPAVRNQQSLVLSHNIDHVAIGLCHAIGKFMAEGLTEDEQAEAAEEIRFVRDNWSQGLRESWLRP